MPMASRLLSLLAVVACKHDAAIDIDGELDEAAWNSRAQRAVFVDATGARARPYSELRMLREHGRVYIGLYAADQDIRSTDHFVLDTRAVHLLLGPTGAAVDLDGTLDKPVDEDEEWVVELALPEELVGTRIAVRRCDLPKQGGERCGSWAGELR